MNNQSRRYRFEKKISHRKAVSCILAVSIVLVFTFNTLILRHAAIASASQAQDERHKLSPATSKVKIDINDRINRACNTKDGYIPPVNTSFAPEPGSTAATILPPHLYPNVHQSCYLLPTSPRDQSQHSYLLQFYPNSFLVVTSENEKEIIRLDREKRTIYIRGADNYYLLWIKTMTLWDYISTQVNSHVFKHCQWFFKVDTDAFLNLHVIEQYLSQYSYKEDHYVGWYSGIGGRQRNGQTVKMAVGPFYGFSRSVMLKWHSWNADGKFTWGHKNDHKGEDSQVAFFLREHGVCLDVPVLDAPRFKSRAGLWEGFDRASPLSVEHFREGCTKRILEMSENECFTYAHKVWLEWMPVMADVLRVHVQKSTKCELFGKGVSRVVKGAVYHKVDGASQCAISDCDPCLKDEGAGGCCAWEVTK
jgi:hypothetical protein